MYVGTYVCNDQSTAVDKQLVRDHYFTSETLVCSLLECTYMSVLGRTCLLCNLSCP